MQLSHRRIATSDGPKRAVIVAPDQDELVQKLGTDPAEVFDSALAFHRSIVQELGGEALRVDAIVLRSRSADGSGQFRLPRDLDEGDLENVGHQLVRAQLEAWRPLLTAAPRIVARVELPVWELAALRTGVARMRAQLETRWSKEDPEVLRSARADAQLLGHSLLNFGVGVETALEELLPGRLEQLRSGSGREVGGEPPAAKLVLVR